MRVDVSVSGGTVSGDQDGGLVVFRGIPFASLREPFGAPQPAAPWDGARPCTEYGPPPPQSNALGTATPGGADEGWLTVNVWSPDLGGSLPVMVWVQGGAYVFGWSGLPEYDGAALARGGVVLVTFNYRVGLVGFGQVEGAPPNRGLLDQVAALEWVRANVSVFGGDPDRVTVFGQSAGGGSVAALLAMPRAAGLFRRAIAQSVQGTYLSPALAADVARVCAAEVGVEPAGLATADPWLLALAVDDVSGRIEEYADRWGRVAHARVLLAPVVDGDVLPTTPWAGLTGAVELMVSHTRDEQRLLTALAGELGEIGAEQADATADLLGPDPARYRAAFLDPQELDEVVRSDWLFRMPSLKLAEAQLEAGGTAYLCELTWPAPGMGGTLGACHGLDVPLVFGNLTAGQPALLLGDPSPAAEALSEQMRTAWVRFATTGDPGWPGFETGATRLFDVVPSVGDYPERVSREIWRNHAPGVLDLAPRQAGPPGRTRLGGPAWADLPGRGLPMLPAGRDPGGDMTETEPVARLREERAVLERRISQRTEEMTALFAASKDSNADDEHDPEGQTIAFERAQHAAMTEQARAHLAEVDAALARVAAGTYGVCEVCGEPIDPARLEARPTARACVRHASGARPRP